MVGGRDVLNRYRKQGSGLPWFLFLDGDGKVLVTSDDPETGSNIGYPGWAGAESHFREMLAAGAKHITAAEVDALVKSAQAFTTAKLGT